MDPTELLLLNSVAQFTLSEANGHSFTFPNSSHDNQNSLDHKKQSFVVDQNKER